MDDEHVQKEVDIDDKKCLVDFEIADLVKSINRFKYKGRYPFKTTMSCQEGSELKRNKGVTGSPAWVDIIPNYKDDMELFRKVVENASSNIKNNCRSIMVCDNYGRLSRQSTNPRKHTLYIDCSVFNLEPTKARPIFESERKEAFTQLKKQFDLMSEDKIW